MKDEDLMELHQERMCELCEDCVYGHKVNTGEHNLCEGSRCDEALEYLKEELDEDKSITRRYLLLKKCK
jgi:hypothetical protein